VAARYRVAGTPTPTPRGGGRHYPTPRVPVPAPHADRHPAPRIAAGAGRDHVPWIQHLATIRDSHDVVSLIRRPAAPVAPPPVPDQHGLPQPAPRSAV